MTLATSSQNAVAYDTNVITLQRLEGAAMLGASLLAYAWLGQSWWLFAALFLLPDLAMIAYLASPRAGALGYNLAHTYVMPAALALAGLVLGPLAFAIAAIWVAHIGFDRMLGYGLKLDTGFNRTHLGPVGKAR